MQECFGITLPPPGRPGPCAACQEALTDLLRQYNDFLDRIDQVNGALAQADRDFAAAADQLDKDLRATPTPSGSLCVNAVIGFAAQWGEYMANAERMLGDYQSRANELWAQLDAALTGCEESECSSPLPDATGVVARRGRLKKPVS